MYIIFLKFYIKYKKHVTNNNIYKTLKKKQNTKEFGLIPPTKSIFTHNLYFTVWQHYIRREWEKCKQRHLGCSVAN